MNHDNQHHDDIDDALRWQLRALRQDGAPGRDLWPGIEAALARPPAARPRRPLLVPVALAASLLAVIGFAGWWLPGPSGAPQATQVAATADAEPTLVQREAAGMTRQYDAALVELGAAASAPAGDAAYRTAIDELDHSAGLILDALAHDPDSRLLLQQLRRTYARRLALSQRAALS